jgi:hypothetical protein
MRAATLAPMVMPMCGCWKGRCESVRSLRQEGPIKRLVMLTSLAAVAAVAFRLVTMAAPGETGDAATTSSLVARVATICSGIPLISVLFRGWTQERLIRLHVGRATLVGFLLAAVLCSSGLAWNSWVAPLTDDSDPSAAIGSGLLVFGVPALAIAVAAIGARILLPRVAIASWLATAALVTAGVPIVGLIAYELMFLRTLWG